MITLIPHNSRRFRSYALCVAAVLLQTSIPGLAQSNVRQIQARWERLVYEDTGALIRETSAEIAKNPQHALAMRMRSSGYYRNGEAEKGKVDAIAALALLKDPARAEEFEAKCYAERRLEKYDEAIVSC